MLRSVDAHLELAYVPVRGAILRGPFTEAASSVDPILNQHSCEFGCGQSPSACRMGLGRHRLQAVGLALSLRPDLGLAEVQKSACACGEAEAEEEWADERRGAYVVAKIGRLSTSSGL